MASAADQLREHESQLSEVLLLLGDSPDDESLLGLKNDLLELISITKAEVQPIVTNAFDQALMNAVGNSVGVDNAVSGVATNPGSSTDAAATAAAPPAAQKDLPKKKASKVKAQFEVPKNLVIHETDSASERNRKRRAAKALKSKWKESVKEAESAKKQKSWQSFQKKKKVKSESMFQTGDTAVGVVSAGRHLTEFKERKRHNHPL